MDRSAYTFTNTRGSPHCRCTVFLCVPAGSCAADSPPPPLARSALVTPRFPLLWRMVACTALVLSGYLLSHCLCLFTLDFPVTAARFHLATPPRFIVLPSFRGFHAACHLCGSNAHPYCAPPRLRHTTHTVTTLLFSFCAVRSPLHLVSYISRHLPFTATRTCRRT